MILGDEGGQFDEDGVLKNKTLCPHELVPLGCAAVGNGIRICLEQEIPIDRDTTCVVPCGDVEVTSP